MPDYEKWEHQHLLAKGKKKGIPGAAKLSQAELIAALTLADDQERQVNLATELALGNLVGWILVMVVMAILTLECWKPATSWLFGVFVMGNLFIWLFGVLGSANRSKLIRRAWAFIQEEKKDHEVDPKQFDQMT